jgi:carbonic anhydrase
MNKKTAITSSFALAALLASGISAAAGAVQWSYSGNQGPEYWGKLAPEFSICSTGKNQSPIDLTGMVEGELPTLKVDYKVGGHEVINNGHTIQINYASGNYMRVGDKSFALKQVHFHSPSDNTIKGRSYPLEVHFVHADKNGNLAVIAVMLEAGKPNAELQKAWAKMPMEKGGKAALKQAVYAGKLLPKNLGYYRYNGSLTTPPCSEGVSWFVMKNPDTTSKEQVDKFVRAMKHANNRPVQPVNARVIVQ